jgi:hypothetical protein
VTQAWVNGLNFMMQSVLLASVRAADGLPKNHVSKLLLRWYRRCVLYSAFESRQAGRPVVLHRPWVRGGGSFTGPSYEVGPHPIDEEAVWRLFDRDVVDKYLASVDEVPHHFHLHLMHAAQIVGYYHSDPVLRAWWNRFYLRCVNDMHLFPEAKEAMAKRLGDSEVDWRAAEEMTTDGPIRFREPSIRSNHDRLVPSDDVLAVLANGQEGANSPRLTAASIGITADRALVRSELQPDPGVRADAAAEILTGMQSMPDDACDVYRCGTPLDGVSRREYDVTGTPNHPWNTRGLGRCYQQLCRTHWAQLGRGIVGYIRSPRPLPTIETAPKNVTSDERCCEFPGWPRCPAHRSEGDSEIGFPK